jgi:hypothetical protein
MMATDVHPVILKPTRHPPRWRVLSMFRAMKWARDARIPFNPHVADKAV